MDTKRERIFREPQKLEQLLVMLKRGHSILFLSLYFNCDRSSILFQARKHNVHKYHGVEKWTKVQIKEWETNHFIRPIDNSINGDPITKGKSYEDYKKENEDREWIAYIKSKDRYGTLNL